MRYYDPATYKEYPSLAAARDDACAKYPLCEGCPVASVKQNLHCDEILLDHPGVLIKALELRVLPSSYMTEICEALAPLWGAHITAFCGRPGDDVIDMGHEEVATMLLAYERIALAYADTEAEEQTARKRIKMLAIDFAEAMGVLQCNTTDK